MIFQKFFICIPLALATISVASVAAENRPASNLNFQGFTGLVAVPSAWVLSYGDFQYNFSNQIELNNPKGRFGGYRDYRDGYNNQLGAGFFPGMEFSGRNVTPYRDRGSDLSANVKFQLPYLANDVWAVAAGIQDMGGAADEYNGYFLVGSYRWQDFDLSAGVGTSQSATGRMDGPFAGVEWTPLEWISVMAEHDGGSENVGMRLSTPSHWFGGYLQLSAMAQLYTTFDSPAYGDDDFYSVSLKFPLFSSEPQSRKLGQKRTIPSQKKMVAAAVVNTQPIAEAVKPENDSVNAQEIAVEAPKMDEVSLKSLADRLARQGFEGVKVASKGNKLYVRFESAVFNRHSMDGLGVAMGLVANHAAAEISDVQLVMMKWGVPVFRMEGSLARYREFLRNESMADTGMEMEVSPWKIEDSVDWVKAGNAPYLRPRWTIRPILSSTFGTEFGVLDYSFAWRQELEVPVWAGGAIYATYDMPTRVTDDYEDGGPFMRNRIEEGEKHMMFSQTFVLPFHISTHFMAGEYATNSNRYDAVSNETWIDLGTPFDFIPGSHLIRTFVGNYDAQEVDLRREVRVWSYRYYANAINTSFEIMQGDFFSDKGWRFEARHYMGDTILSTYLKENDNDTRMFGLGISFPLTARKDMSSRYGLQVKGAPSWRYDLETRVGDRHNRLASGVTSLPTLAHGLRGTYYDGDRLNTAWVRQHSYRLREAWQHYGSNESTWGSWSEDTGLDRIMGWQQE
jgi:hypothetical protein